MNTCDNIKGNFIQFISVCIVQAFIAIVYVKEEDFHGSVWRFTLGRAFYRKIRWLKIIVGTKFNDQLA